MTRMMSGVISVLMMVGAVPSISLSQEPANLRQNTASFGIGICRITQQKSSSRMSQWTVS